MSGGVCVCVFVISFSNFITSTEINLSNYGNIVVQPVVWFSVIVRMRFRANILHTFTVFRLSDVVFGLFTFMGFGMLMLFA